MRPAIGGQSSGDAMILNPPHYEGVDDGLSRYGGDWDGGRPSRKTIHDCEKVSVAIRERHGDQVQMHMFEPSVGHREFTDRGHRVPDDLGLLAWDTLPGPSGHVLVHGRPHYLGLDGLLRPLDAWMS